MKKIGNIFGILGFIFFILIFVSASLSKYIDAESLIQPFIVLAVVFCLISLFTIIFSKQCNIISIAFFLDIIVILFISYTLFSYSGAPEEVTLKSHCLPPKKVLKNPSPSKQMIEKSKKNQPHSISDSIPLED